MLFVLSHCSALQCSALVHVTAYISVVTKHLSLAMSHCSLALSRHPPRSAVRVIVRFCEIIFFNTLNRALRVQIVKSGRNALKFWPDLQKTLMNPGNMRRAGGALAREHGDHISERVEFFDMFWGPNLRSYIFRGNLRYFPTQN